MQRSPNLQSVYGHRTIEQINRTLRGCAESIKESESIEDSWVALTSDLCWSAVMSSKTLHFLCRSLGFEQNPPVPIDSVIRNKVWPAFRDPIPFAQRPEDWQGDSFDAYCRYMTAIATLANKKNWTTTQVETTLFDQFRKN
jgi:hypothetical protein